MNFDFITKELVSFSTVGLAIIVFIVSLIVSKLKNQKITLYDLLVRSLAASTLPTGIVLILCAFELELIDRLEGLNVHIAAAGLALIYIAFNTMIGGKNSANEDEEDES